MTCLFLPKNQSILRSMIKLLFLIYLLAPSCNAEVIRLDSDNYSTLTSGKTVFIKFFAPWCVHCQSMKSDWEKLFEEWKSHPVGLVAEVDCTEAEDLCEEFELTEYPTLFFGDPTALEMYEGKTDYESLSEFAKENLGDAICSVYSIDGCSEVDKMIISEMEAKTLEDLSMDLSEVEKLAEDEEEKFEFKIDELEEQYEKLISSYNEKVEEIRINRHYNLVREILRMKLENI